MSTLSELTEQPPLDVLVSELLLQQRVVPQEDLSTGEVVGSVLSHPTPRNKKRKLVSSSSSARRNSTP